MCPSPNAQREAARAGSRQVVRRVSYGFDVLLDVLPPPPLCVASGSVPFFVSGVELAVPVSVGVVVVVVSLSLLSAIGDELFEPLTPNDGDVRPVVHFSEYNMPPTAATAATMSGSRTNTSDPSVMMLLSLLLADGTATSVLVVLSSRVPRVEMSVC